MKERLLGAAVLIAAAVLIIPALLDGPKPSGQASPDTVSRELQLPAPAAGTAAEPNQTHTVEFETDKTAPEVDGADDEPPQAGSATDLSDGKPSEPPASTTMAPAPAAATAPASGAAGETAANPVPAAGWAVQVGSFANESNARRLMELLKARGYPAFVARNVVNGRVRFRVRVGPEADRLRAEALLDRLKSDRQQTQLVRHP